MSFRDNLDEGQRLYKAGRYSDCNVRMAGVVAAAAEKSVDDSQRAEAYLEYGKVLQKLARFQQSEENLLKARDIYDKLRGRQSFEYSEVLNELGLLYYDQDDLDKATVVLEEALSIRRAIYSGVSKDTAKVLQSLGEVFWRKGHHNSATAHLDESLEMYRQTVGEEHEDFADSLADRCLVMLSLGEMADAEAGLRRCLAIREKCLPADHALIGNALANLAHALAVQGKKDGVEDMIKRSIDIASNSYGEFSPRTAICINNLGGFYLDQGNLLEAGKFFEKALNIKEKVLGKDSQGLILTLNNLSIVYERLNKKAEARELRTRSDLLMKKKIDDSEQKDVDTMIYLADKLAVDDKRAEALNMLHQALGVASAEFGSNSLKVAQVLGFLAVHAQKDGDIEKAREYFTAILRIQKKHLGKKHRQVAETLRQLSACMSQQGQNDVALLLTQQAHAIEFASGVEDPDIAAMRKMLNQRRDAKGPKDPLVIQTMRMMSEMYRLKGDNEKSDALFEEYMQARAEADDGDLLELANELLVRALSSMPVQYLFNQDDALLSDIDQSSLRAGIVLLDRAAAFQETSAKAGGDSEDLASTLTQLAQAHVALKNYEVGETILRRALALAEEAHGTEHWSLRGTLDALKKVVEKQGRSEEAQSLAKRTDALPQASREEQQEHLRRATAKVMGSMGRMMQAFNTFSEDEAADSVADGS